MDDPTQSFAFKERLLKCKPIDPTGSHFIMDIRKGNLEYGAPYSDVHPQESATANAPFYRQWCALPSKRALVTHLPQILP